MSALRGTLVGVGLLIVEEVLVTSKGGPAAVSGATGVLVGAIDRFADPTIPAIPNRSKTAPPKDPTNGGLAPGTTPNTQVPLGNGTSTPAKNLPGRPGSGVSP